MNARQKALYNYLLSRNDEWTTQMEIAFALNEWYDVSTFGGAMDFHNSQSRLQITADIREINENPEVEKVIISGSKGVKIANEEEFARFIKKQYGAVFRRLARVRSKERKGNRNGQIDFGGHIVESFLKGFAE